MELHARIEPPFAQNCGNRSPMWDTRRRPDPLHYPFRARLRARRGCRLVRGVREGGDLMEGGGVVIKGFGEGDEEEVVIEGRNTVLDLSVKELCLGHFLHEVRPYEVAELVFAVTLAVGGLFNVAMQSTVDDPLNPQRLCPLQRRKLPGMHHFLPFIVRAIDQGPDRRRHPDPDRGPFVPLAALPSPAPGNPFCRCLGGVPVQTSPAHRSSGLCLVPRAPAPSAGQPNRARRCNAAS
jgi:hypothetical protein